MPARFGSPPVPCADRRLPPDPDDAEVPTEPALTGPAAFAAALLGRPYLADDLDDLQMVPPIHRERLRDRLEAAWACGLLSLTPAQYEEVLVAFMPEDFVPKPPDSPPSPTLAGTAERVADYCARVRRREAVRQAADGLACPGGVRVVKRKNRNARNAEIGAKVLGPAAEPPRPLPPGMYRTARGRWIEIGDYYVDERGRLAEAG